MAKTSKSSKAKSAEAAPGKSAKKASGKRELIAPRGNKRYARRTADGRFSEMDDVKRSLSQDVRRHSKKEVKPGYGDKGDQPKKSAAKKK